MRLLIAFVALTAGFFQHGVAADASPNASQSVVDPTVTRLDHGFRNTVQPFLKSYCIECHNATTTEGDLDLSRYQHAASVTDDYRRWAVVLERLDAGDMPPDDAERHPTPDARREIIEWIRAARDYEAEHTASDPGLVLAQRLSNAEYDYTIRDLTGVDIRPTLSFPVDPANEAGFDNTGESLTMSPALLKKYLEAARHVSEHLVFTPDTLEFAPYPILADTDRDKFCVNRIIAFYQRQQTDYADYFFAAWCFQNRAALGKPNATLADFAREKRLSPKYLTTLWALLSENDDEHSIGPIAALRAMWHELKAGDAGAVDAARQGCERLRDFVVELRSQLVPDVPNLTAPGVHDGSQPLVLWKNRQLAANRMRYSGGALKIESLDLPEGSTAATAMIVPEEPESQQRFEATFDRFCSVFPDAFVVSERARVYLDAKEEKKLTGRLLSAGFHSQMGYFRDDEPLYELMLSEEEQSELDRLWWELDFVASAPVRQYTGFLWFDRTDSRFLRDPEFDFARAEDKDCISDEKVSRLSELYLAKAARNGANEDALKAISDYFRDMSAKFRHLEESHREAEPKHLVALEAFAERAYRRPLTPTERDGLREFYQLLRETDGLDHTNAIRDCVVAVLMSPHFCYRVDLPGDGDGPVQPLSDHALASRLSYFLWSSMPDDELRTLAAAGTLHQPDILRAQTQRMLRDGKCRGLATEFGGNWLDFRRFEEHNAVDRERFPSFDNDLREAMFEEPVRFLVDLFQRNGSLLECLYADHTFVNNTLARQYELPRSVMPPSLHDDEWVRVEGARAFGRGGLAPMSVFLTKNAPGLRTSPVKRGYWVARRLLGENIPAPPPNVPELPSDESKLGELTLREALAQHRADKSCSGCHERFDSLGLVFEGYGPIGERRTLDLGDRPVDTAATFPNGEQSAGFNGLMRYIRDERQNDFVENFCRKLLAYGLGRTLQLSDEATIREMQQRLASDDYRVGGLIEIIVTSPQFLNRRGDHQLAAGGRS